MPELPDVPGLGDPVWSVEEIAGLDWLRIAELLRAMAAHAGCELGGSRVFPDGSVLFAMVERPKSPHPQRALVRIAPWNEWGATPGLVTNFSREVAAARNARGVLVAPGGYSTSARHLASEHRIEAVDAAQLVAALQTLPHEQGRFFRTITLAGDATSPTCPVCLRKLTRVQKSTSPREVAVQAEMIFSTSTIAADPVVCSRLTVQAGCEVQFLHEVRAKEIIIAGQATGDFLCDGPVTLERGATLTGTVSARAIRTQEGAELIGPARIIEGPLAPMVSTRPAWVWQCQNPQGKPVCKSVCFELHERD
jgi:hypothetical protein